MSKRIVPYGDKILIQRRKTGDKTKGNIILPDQVADRPTDVADVVYVPDHTFCDKALIDGSESIVSGLVKKAQEGDGQAFMSLLNFRSYLMLKSIKPGDTLLVGKFIGTDFNIKETGESLTVMDSDGIYAIIEDAT